MDILNNKIDSSDITFVVQGVICEINTKKTIDSIKKYFPSSQIILSTWEGSETAQYNVSEVVLNKDPGGFYSDKRIQKAPNNINRQITSTINGLKQVKTKYAFKIRTDFELTGNNFLKFFDNFNVCNSEYKFFNHKVIACNLSTCNSRKKDKFAYCFHISDFAFFGLTEDLIDLFDIPLVDIDDKIFVEKGYFSRFVPEQIIITEWLKKHNFKFNFKCFNDKNKDNIFLTEQVIVNNFILLNYDNFSVYPLKKSLQPPKSMQKYIKDYGRNYTQFEYFELYKKYCDNSIDLLLLKKYDKLNLNKYKLMLYEPLLYIRKLIFKPIANIMCWFVKDKNLKHKIRQFFY